MNWMQPLKEKDFFGIMSLPGRVEDTAPERSGTDFEQILLQKIGHSGFPGRAVKGKPRRRNIRTACLNSFSGIRITNSGRSPCITR